MMNIERARELKNNVLWGDICEEINKKIFHITETLKTCKPEELVQKQNTIQALESVKRLPDDIIDRESEA